MFLVFINFLKYFLFNEFNFLKKYNNIFYLLFKVNFFLGKLYFVVKIYKYVLDSLYCFFNIYVIVLYLKILYLYYIGKYIYFYGENYIYICIKDLIGLFFFYLYIV